MQFEFEGELYRIAFHHPVPTDLYYHAGHEVELVRGRHAQRGGVIQKTGHRPMRLMCAECEARTGREVQLFPAPKGRSVECGVYVCQSRENSKPEWELVLRGSSKLNRKAKDRYTREGGRVAALNNALYGGTAAFCAAA